MLTKTKMLYGKENMSIYRAYDEVNKKFVALKISKYRPKKKPSRDSILYKKHEDAREEGKLLHKIPTHPNIVTLIKSHTVGDYTQTILEYAHTDLFDMMDLYDLTDYDLTIHIISDMVKGLHHLHTNGIAHMDISMENTILCEGNHIKLCDFGLAIRISNRYNLQKIGKTNYMAPEMFNSVTRGDEYDYRKHDIYSLGVCILCMVTGSTQWDKPTITDKRFSNLMRMGVSVFLKWIDPTLKLPLPIKKLLSMTLQYNNTNRSNTQDIMDYLGNINIDHKAQNVKLFYFTKEAIKDGLYDTNPKEPKRRMTN
jgi:serine/threonine protein kinase